MKKIKPLSYKLLKCTLDLSLLSFQTTKEIVAEGLSRKIIHHKKIAGKKFIGQDRAWNAFQFGIGIKGDGYNLYAMGSPGIGKRHLISQGLAQHAKLMKTPFDWCYLYNFSIPEKPIALSIPAGMGRALQKDMQDFVESALAGCLSTLESDEYRHGIKRIARHFELQRKRLIDKAKKNTKRNQHDLTSQFYPTLQKKRNEKEKKFQHDSVTTVIRPLLKKLKWKYQEYEAVINYLNDVKNDMANHIDEMIRRDENTNLLTFSNDNPLLVKYKVNVLVDNSELKGAPIIFEDTPSYSSIVSRIEYTAQMGTLVTNFTLIKAGSLHRANGGYLVISARKLRKNPDAWEELKSALYAKEIAIKPIEHESDLFKPVSLEPAPIPLTIKIILIGSRNTYYSLCERDKDFLELFKVALDFDEDIKRNKKNIALFARYIAETARQKKLRDLHVKAVGAIIEYSSRLADDKDKMSTHMSEIDDLIIESNYWAEKKGRNIIEKRDVLLAIEQKIHRMDRARDLYYEDILRDFILIKTFGNEVGQINCLSVRKVGSFTYGHPTRVTARVRLGKGKIIDIQREIKMAGPAHSKASLIISNFLASRFNQNQPFSLFASLSFEQVYCWTDGDSASVGELCAILSAIANIPINQALAVTGSIDQYGVVQAIGGVNDKIEGYFDVCRSRGLTGTQGVLIPKVNQQNLMLRQDVIEAVKVNQFFIFPIETINDALTLLTGVEAGDRNRQGRFPEHSFNAKIENRLNEFYLNRMK